MNNSETIAAIINVVFLMAGSFMGGYGLGCRSTRRAFEPLCDRLCALLEAVAKPKEPSDDRA